MAFTEGSEEGALNDTSYVVVLQAPGANERRITKNVTVLNRDTGALTLQLFINDSVTYHQFGQVTVQTYQAFIWDRPIVLNSASKTLEARLTGSVAVSQPSFITTYAVIS